MHYLPHCLLPVYAILTALHYCWCAVFFDSCSSDRCGVSSRGHGGVVCAFYATLTTRHRDRQLRLAVRCLLASGCYLLRTQLL